MSSRRDVGVVVVAAGRGERAGAGDPKQLRLVDGVPVLLRALRPFLAHPAVDRVVAVVPAAVAAEPPGWLGELTGDRLTLVPGGAERADSVERGLDALPADAAVVIVHDGARPFVEPGVIDRVIEVARSGVGAVAAVPVADTLKLGSPAGPGAVRIERTVPRENLWRAQTPQAFPAELLREALARARRDGIAVTDDATAVEAMGVTVLLVADRTTNLKLTTPDDFVVAEALARTTR